MGRIRIYELASEANVPSKGLADKLIDLGYNIKSHSSTVTDDVADEIRRNVLGTAKTKIVEKRISVSGKSGATVIRRRATTVRTEPPVEPAIVEEAPAVEAGPSETRAVVRRRPAVEAVAEQPETVETALGREAGVAPEAEAATPPAAESGVPATTAEEARAAGEEPAMEVPEPAGGEEDSPLAPAVEGTKRTVPLKGRKGFATIIKRAAIKIETEQPRPTATRPATARPAAARPGQAERTTRPVKPKGRPAATPATTPNAEARGGERPGAPGLVRGKKKGKRLVQIFQEEESKDRFRKSPVGKRKTRRGETDESYLERGMRLKGRKGEARRRALEAPAAETKAIKKRIKVLETISVGDLAHRMGAKVSQVIARLMGLGVMATLNQALDVDTAALVAADFGYEVEQAMTNEQTVLNLEEQEGGGEPLPRPPVVTVMGHVDHGKTSILDAIRKTDVAAAEAGGITQHIGAYYVRSAAGDVVFLDTPGHAAFTEMRSRGAQVTDVVVLVVAADDGVMDQTKEAINHAQAAKVPIVVAVNKIDKPNADIGRVKRELADCGLVPEDWGGDVIYCETSAKQNLGIEELLTNILLQAEILELKADPKRRARGRVVEAQLHKGRGAVATVLIQEGTLRAGDPFVVGQHYGKVRSLINDKGEFIEEAGPAMPVEVQGLSGVPQAGDEFMVVTDEKMARSVSASRQLKARETELASTSKISLDKLFEQMREGEVKELRVVLRSDVQGTLEAFGQAIENLSTAAVKVKVLHEGTGTITESDVLLASASEAIIIGFNVRPSAKVRELAEREKVDIRSYDVIYHALDDIRKAMTGMLEPTFEERVIGSAEVRETFQVPKIGTIAGCYVSSGKIERNARARLLRDGVVVHTGRITSLRRFKEDAKEVQSGYECGIGLENYNDLKVGDIIEAFLLDQVASVL